MKERSYSLDFLRICATVLVVFHHYQQLTGGRFEYFNFYSDEKQVFTVLIELFFVLSGYLLAGTVIRIKDGLSFKDFIVKKLVRLLPIGAVSVIAYEALMFVIVTFIPDFPSYFAKDINVWGAIVTAFGMQAGWVFENPFINNPLWYVSVLVWCYILFYFVTYLSKKINCSPVYFYIAIILIGFAVNSFSINQPFLNGYMARGYVSFFPGVLLGIYRKKHEIKVSGIVTSLIVILAFLFMTHSHFGYISRGYNYIFIFFIATSFITLFDSNILRKCLKLKVIGFLSNISYGMIVWHVPVFIVILIVKHLTNIDIDYNNPLTMLAFTGIVAVYCIAAYYLVEKNVVKCISNKLGLE